MMQSSYLRPLPNRLGTDVQLWWIDLDAYANTVAIDQSPSHDTAQPSRMARGQDARRLLAIRHALSSILGGLLGCSPEDLVFERDALGKLRLIGEKRAQFNFSHSGHQGVVGVSRSHAVGVDIELVREVPDVDVIARSQFTAREQEEWRRAPDAQRHREFLTCWTRKEACVKALGVGFLIQPAAVEVGCLPFQGEVCIPLGRGRCVVEVASLPLWGDAVAAAALATPEAAADARSFVAREIPPG